MALRLQEMWGMYTMKKLIDLVPKAFEASAKAREAKAYETNRKRDRLNVIAKAVIDDACKEGEIDKGLSPVSRPWYFVTPEQHRAITQANADEPLAIGTIDYLYGYELMTTSNPDKTGRQRDAIEIVYVIDTYPSYPRVIPQ